MNARLNAHGMDTNQLRYLERLHETVPNFLRQRKVFRVGATPENSIERMGWSLSCLSYSSRTTPTDLLDWSEAVKEFRTGKYGVIYLSTGQLKDLAIVGTFLYGTDALHTLVAGGDPDAKVKSVDFSVILNPCCVDEDGTRSSTYAYELMFFRKSSIEIPDLSFLGFETNVSTEVPIGSFFTYGPPTNLIPASADALRVVNGAYVYDRTAGLPSGEFFYRALPKLIEHNARLEVFYEQLEAGASGLDTGFVSVQNSLADLAPPSWLIDGFIEENSLVELYGPPTSGKSLLALDWGLSTANGKSWYGNDVRQGPVFYLAGEGAHGLRRRCSAWAKYHGVEAQNSPFFFNDFDIRLIDENSCKEVAKRIRQTVGDTPPKLIVIDTYNRVCGGDENGAKDTSRLLTLLETYFLRPFGCTVLIVHHSGKDGSKTSRGSSALPAGMDAVFRLDGIDGTRTLTCTKQKDAPPPSDMYLQMQPVSFATASGDQLSSAVLVRTNKPKSKSSGKLSPNALKLKELIEELMRDQSEPLPQQIADLQQVSDSPESVTVRRLAPAFFALSVVSSLASEDARKKAFYRARKELENSGFVHHHQGYIWFRT